MTTKTIHLQLTPTPRKGNAKIGDLNKEIVKGT